MPEGCDNGPGLAGVTGGAYDGFSYPRRCDGAGPFCLFH